MLEVLVFTLKAGLEAALVLGMLSALRAGGEGDSRIAPTTRYGLLLGATAGLALAYGVSTFLEREAVAGLASSLQFLLVLLLLLWIVRQAVFARDTRVVGQKAGDEQPRAQRALFLLASAAITAPAALEIALSLARAPVQATGLLSTERIDTMAAGLLGLAVVVAAGLAMNSVAARISPRRLALPAIAVLLILLLREATTAAQIAMVRGLLPLSGWPFALIAFLVNSYGSFYYALFGAACLLTLLAAREWRRGKRLPGLLNPAQARKLKAGYRHTGVLISAAGAILALSLLADAAAAHSADHSIELSPATPVHAAGDKVLVPAASVSDGKLHRLSFETHDGTVVRFLVAHKGSNVFGVGLDACPICGIAGYRQEGANIVCSRCGAAINIATMGFPGGCNPIPLGSSGEGDSLAVLARSLEEASAVFAR